MRFVSVIACTLTRPFLLTLSLATVVGCSSEERPAPQMYAVSGTVVDHLGQPVKDGAIDFGSVDSPGINAVVDVKPDGSFVLSTLFDQRRIPGTVAGKHTVVYIPRQINPEKDVPIALPDPVTVEPKDDNVITIRLPAPNPPPN